MDNTAVKKVNEFLKNNSLGVLATISSETGGPQGGLIYQIADEKAHIYIASARDSKKFLNILKNPRVALVISHAEKAIEVQIEATAREVTDTVMKEEVINKISIISNASPRTHEWPPLLTLSMNSGVACIELTIEKFKYSDFSMHPGDILSGTGKELLYNYS